MPSPAAGVGSVPLTTPSQLPSTSAPARVDGSVLVYRQYDVGEGIDLEVVLTHLASSAPRRAGPARGEAQAIQIRNLPVTVQLGEERVPFGDQRLAAEVCAAIFDFAVISLRVEIRLPADLPWRDLAEFGNRLDLVRDLAPVFDRHVRALLERISPAVKRPAIAPVTEDYVVFRVNALRDAEGAPFPAERLTDQDMVHLLLDERRALSEAARRELLPHRFSYYADDLALLTWNNALVVEPVREDADVQFVLEFANAQLLELRVLDHDLDRDLPRMLERIAAARRGAPDLLGRRFAPLLAELQTRMADAAEVIERVENALKVTDDVYLARIYSAALEIFRERAWRKGIERKLDILRDTYAMLSAESQAVRAELLEIAIVALIVVEIVLGLVRR